MYTENMADISLRLPFNGDFPVTFGFGATSENEEIKKKFAEWGIVGHNGIDYGLPKGTEVVACADGKVIQSGDNGDFGISVTIQHPWRQTLYAHLKETKVSQDQEVKAGDVVGLSGQTGSAFGEHLHFAIKPNDSDTSNGYLGFVDPSQYFRKSEEKPVEQQPLQAEPPKIEETKPIEEQKPEETKPPEEKPIAPPQQPEVKEAVKEVIKEVIKEVPVVNQEEVQRQVTERLKVEQDERRKLANEARVERKKDNLNKILAFVQERKTVTNDDVCDYLHISQSTATNYLTELVNRGMLKREGERGGTKYTA